MRIQIGNLNDAKRFVTSIIKNTVFLLLVFLISYYITAVYFGKLYYYYFPSIYGGGLFTVPQEAAEFIMGFVLSYLFFLPLLFTAFGGKHKYWWIGILLIPAAVFELWGDLPHIYFPILLGLLGWLVGFGIKKLIGVLRKT